MSKETTALSEQPTSLSIGIENNLRSAGDKSFKMDEHGVADKEDPLDGSGKTEPTLVETHNAPSASSVDEDSHNQASSKERSADFDEELGLVSEEMASSGCLRKSNEVRESSNRNVQFQVSSGSDDSDDEPSQKRPRRTMPLQHMVSRRINEWHGEAHAKLFGDKYSTREGIFVIAAGGLIAFNSGYVNGSCLSGLLSPNGIRQSVAGVSGAYTESGLALADGNFGHFSFESSIILSYMLGAFLSGVITPNETAYRIEPTYGPTFLIGGVFLLISSVLAALEFSERYIFFFAAAANGVQNGIASIYSANLIRCSLTGASVDIALVIGQLIRGNTKKLWKAMVLALIVLSFWLGGIVSFYATTKFRTYSLFVNAGLFILIGLSLVYFLVHELHISVRAALLGTWEWNMALGKLHKRMIHSMHGGDNHEFNIDPSGMSSQSMESRHFDMLFDRVDREGKGKIEEDDLMRELERAGADASDRAVKTLMKSAGAEDGSIKRDEWRKLCYDIRSRNSRSSNSTSARTSTSSADSSNPNHPGLRRWSSMRTLESINESV